jgi:ferredoxin/DNA-binding transcriptional regulator YiaG
MVVLVSSYPSKQMSYSIPENCSGCGSCQTDCPTDAIKQVEGQLWIDPTLCNHCEGFYPEPLCVVQCPISCPVPLQPKKGRYKATVRMPTSPDIFLNGKNNPFASSMVVWEACNLLTSASQVPWQLNAQGQPYYERTVKQGGGAIVFRLTDDIESDSPKVLEQEAALAAIEGIDIRSACLHLIYAAYATTLDRPWEQEFVISDRQIEQYLGLDKRKDLSKATKLTLIKALAQQPCQILTSIDWPQQGQVRGFSVPEDRLWHLLNIKHHFQKDTEGNKYLTGLTFTVKAGAWAQYFLNKNDYRKRTAFYQYGTLPKFLLSSVMSIWQQHIGAARMMLWLLFKAKMGRKQCITIPTLMRVAYGEEKMSQASLHSEHRKRLIRCFESDLEVLNHYGLKPLFDATTYVPEIQPLWAKLAELPDDAEEALDFWINDGSQDQRLTDSSPRGKWNRLMKARISWFNLPPEWEQQLAKLDKKKTNRIARKTPTSTPMGLSANQIANARKRQGISQRLLAEMAGKSQSWIRDLEKGRFSAKPKDEAMLRKVLEI